MAAPDRDDLSGLIDALFSERSNAAGLTASEWAERSGKPYLVVRRAIEKGIRDGVVTRGKRYDENITGVMVPKVVFLPVKGK